MTFEKWWTKRFPEGFPVDQSYLREAFVAGQRQQQENDSPLRPSPTLLIKLGSIAVHADEYLSPGGHPIDRTVIEGLIADPEVEEWVAEMDKLAFLPKKRN